MRIRIVALLVLITGGCNSVWFNNIDRLYQIYPVKSSEKPSYNTADKDKIIMVIFPGDKIKPVNKDESWGEYLVVGKKWAEDPVNTERIDADTVRLEKYISINSIIKHNIFPNQENQIVVTLDICTPHASTGGQYHVAVVTLIQNKGNYEIYSEYYDVGRTFAPSVAVDIDNDGLIEIALFKGQWWGHPWGYKYLNILKGENNSLVNILETLIISFNYGGIDDDVGQVNVDYNSIVEIDQNSSVGYCPIIKTVIEIRHPPMVRAEAEGIWHSIKVIREIFKWNGEKYISSETQVLLEHKTQRDSSEPAEQK